MQEDTGTWLLEVNEFKNWIIQDHDTPEDQHTLFCPGLPGAGKPILTSVVINELQENLQQAGVGVAFFLLQFPGESGPRWFVCRYPTTVNPTTIVYPQEYGDDL